MAPDSINTIGGEIAVNGRSYKLPRRPTVVVCIDGSEPGYIEAAVAAGASATSGAREQEESSTTATQSVAVVRVRRRVDLRRGRPCR